MTLKTQKNLHVSTPDREPASAQLNAVRDRLKVATDFPAAITLAERFRVDLTNGSVWVDDHRVLVLQAEWFGDLRHELINRLGLDGARTVLTRLGYASGIRDANLSMRLNANFNLLDLIATGREFHAFQGSVASEPVALEVDMAAKHCYLEFLWTNSIEDELQANSAHAKRGSACWMEIGYASGFLSTCMGANVIVREVECASLGKEQCRCVARFAHEWGDVSEDMKYLDPGYLPPAVGSPGVDLTASRRAPSAQNDLAPETIAADTFGSPTLVGRSAAFKTTLYQARRVARTDATVLLLGESGVGKSALAHFLHSCSRRADKPFIEVNCAAIPESLLESELFGVERGAFTGAANSRSGRFEEAEGGTIFLDEIGLLTGPAQGKLLRVLQNQQYERLGSSKTQQANVRLVAATNNDLVAAVRDGTFRTDLFYRLNVFPITVPPLRGRVGDLPLLIDHLVAKFCQRHGHPGTGLTPAAYRAMLNHRWPGNIRELENVLERAVILLDADEPIDEHHLFTNVAGFERNGLLWLDQGGKLIAEQEHETAPTMPIPGSTPSWVDLALKQPGQSLQDIEQAVVLAAMKACGNSVVKTAERLGLSRAQIDYRLKKWEVEAR